MTNEQRFPLSDLHRIYVEVDVRDVAARWHEREDVAVHGNGIEAYVEAGELFITTENNRAFNKETVEIELPLQATNFTVKAERADVTLDRPQGKIEMRLDSGDLQVTDGAGDLTLSSGRGNLKVNTFVGNVTANSGSGDKQLHDVTGDIVVHSGSGEAKLLRGHGSVIINGASGDVIMSDRDVSTLKVATASGDVIIRGGRLGQATIETASGDIACESALAIASYDFTAASGDIALSIQRDLAVRVDAATTRGSINSDLPLVAIQQRGPRNPHGKRVVGSTSDAAERAEITLRTTSGDIALNWSNAPVPAPPPAQPMRPEPGPVIPLSPPTPTTPHADNPIPHDLFEDDRQRVILNALADGSLSVEEASRLLDALSAPANGAR